LTEVKHIGQTDTL